MPALSNRFSVRFAASMNRPYASRKLPSSRRAYALSNDCESVMGVRCLSIAPPGQLLCSGVHVHLTGQGHDGIQVYETEISSRTLLPPCGCTTSTFGVTALLTAFI